MSNTPDISIIIPVFDEEESITELSVWIDKVNQESQLSYEIIFVDDGSKDASWKTIESLSDNNSSIKGIRFSRNYGKSASLDTGFKAATGKVVITMDADLQDSPNEIPSLYNMITKDGYDLVSGWKKKRRDPFTKKLPSKFFNVVTRKISRIILQGMGMLL